MPRAVSRNVLLLGLTSLLADVASEMVVPLLPAFIVMLGGGATFVGVIEGAAEATAGLLKWVSGRWADRAKRLLPLAALGYAIAAAARPFLALAAAPWQVLALRCTDRVGKGLRTSPRDKLLAGSAPEDRLAEAFSFHRGMDHLGAAIGPLCAAGLLTLWPGGLRRIFLVASVPGVCAVLALLLVREGDARPGPGRAPAAGPGPNHAAQSATAAALPAGTQAPGVEASQVHRSVQRVPPALLVAVGLFALGNSSDALLLLRAQGTGVPVAHLPLLWTALHLVRAALSWPLGRLADRLGRRASLAAGWLWYALCYAGFALLRTPLQAWALFVAYGVVAGLTEGSERALVASAVPAARRGRALGLYNLVTGAGLLVASVLAGLLWDRVSPALALGLGAAFAASAALVLVAAAWSSSRGPRA